MAYARNIAGLKLEGRQETMDALQKVKRLVNSEAVQDVLIVPARLIRDVAKRFVRRGLKAKAPGYMHLQDAIFATKGRRAKGAMIDLATSIYGEPGPSVIVGVDRKRAPHAHLIEYGHGGRAPAPAHPYMRPAVDSTRSGVVQMVESGLRRLLAPFST